jgi:hypothetical protein
MLCKKHLTATLRSAQSKQKTLAKAPETDRGKPSAVVCACPLRSSSSAKLPTGV